MENLTINNGENEIMEAVEVLDTNSEILEEVFESNNNLLIGTAVIAGIIVGGYGLKKLWERRKKSKETISIITDEVYEEELEEEIEE